MQIERVRVKLKALVLLMFIFSLTLLTFLCKIKAKVQGARFGEGANSQTATITCLTVPSKDLQLPASYFVMQYTVAKPFLFCGSYLPD